MKARDVMTSNPITIGTGHSVHHAARIMLKNGVSGLPVLNDDSTLAGILTEGDLLRRTGLCGVALRVDHNEDEPLAPDDVETYIKQTSWKAVDCMSPIVISVQEDEDVNHIASLMLANDIKRVLVMRNDQLTGIVSRSDILDCIVTGRRHETALSDVATQRAILARLHFDLGFSPSTVDTSVSNGHAVLSGTIPTEAQRKAARVAAEAVSGVSKITNKLVVADVEAANE